MLRPKGLTINIPLEEAWIALTKAGAPDHGFRTHTSVSRALMQHRLCWADPLQRSGPCAHARHPTAEHALLILITPEIMRRR